MSNDRIPVALKYAPKGFAKWSEDRAGAAVQAAMQEFIDADVYREKWGLKVLLSIPVNGAGERFFELSDRLFAACEYACVDLDRQILDARG